MNSTSLASSNKHGNLKRSLSRLASVQALYQITLLSEEPDNIIDNYLKNYLKVISSYENENESNFDEIVYFDKIDHKFFNKLTKGTWSEIDKIDSLIEEFLHEEWPINRLEILIKSILRLGIGEIILFEKTPPKVIITEYMEITSAYYDEKEVKMINAILDKIIHLHRKKEIK